MSENIIIRDSLLDLSAEEIRETLRVVGHDVALEERLKILNSNPTD